MKLELLRSSLLFALILSGCTGRGGDSGNTTETDTDTDTDTDADADADTDTDTDTDADSGFTISGGTYYLAEKAAGGEGLTVAVADPTPALSGGEVETIGYTTTGADGGFAVSGLPTDLSTQAPFGIFMIVSGSGTMTSATGIDVSEYTGMTDGSVLGDKTALVISSDFQAGIDASLAAAGYTGDTVVNTGMLLLLVRDSAGNPIGGATVTCGIYCGTVYYLDGDSSDGLFTTGGSLNTETSSDSAIVVVPGGGIDTYEAEDGVSDFESRLAGSLPGLAAFAGIYAN